MAAKRAVGEAKENRSSSAAQSNGLVVPPGLVKAIEDGTCVAFVGAGFSGAARLPGWGALLTKILEEGKEKGRLDDTMYDEITAMIGRSEFEPAAQIMEDELGGDFFADVLKVALAPPEELPEAMSERLKLLYSIPFGAIVTTNFDYFLPGVPAAHETAKPIMRSILRSSPQKLVEQTLRQIMLLGKFMKELGEDEELHELLTSIQETGQDEWEKMQQQQEEGDSDSDASSVDVDSIIQALPIIQLHGTVIDTEHTDVDMDNYMVNDGIRELFNRNNYPKEPGLAFTRKGYRELLYGNAAYRKFLAGLMATKTILYIGFSFSDAYINEMRSETMMMLENMNAKEDSDEEVKERHPIAYAITIDKPVSEVKMYKKHEGVQFLNYIPEEKPGFEGIEKWLEAISLKTNPLFRWSKCLKGKKLLVIGRGFYQCVIRMLSAISGKAFKDDFGTVTYLPMPDPDEEITQDMFSAALAEKDDGFDLALVSWSTHGHPSAKLLMDAIRTRPFEKRYPVMVLETQKAPKKGDPRQFFAQRKQEAFTMGATGYVSSLPVCLEEVNRVLRIPSGPLEWESSMGCTVH